MKQIFWKGESSILMSRVTYIVIHLQAPYCHTLCDDVSYVQSYFKIAKKDTERKDWKYFETFFFSTSNDFATKARLKGKLK